MRLKDSKYYGYWQKGNDIKRFLTLKSNGSVLVSLEVFLKSRMESTYVKKR